MKKAGPALRRGSAFVAPPDKVGTGALPLLKAAAKKFAFSLNYSRLHQIAALKQCRLRAKMQIFLYAFVQQNARTRPLSLCLSCYAVKQSRTSPPHGFFRDESREGANVSGCRRVDEVIVVKDEGVSADAFECPHETLTHGEQFMQFQGNHPFPIYKNSRRSLLLRLPLGQSSSLLSSIF